MAVGLLPVHVLALPEDDLPAACREVEQGGLVGHGPGEAQAVEQHLALVAIRPPPDAAEGGAADRVVDAQECTQAGGPVMDRDGLLEALAGHGIEDVHGHDRRRRLHMAGARPRPDAGFLPGVRSRVPRSGARA